MDSLNSTPSTEAGPMDSATIASDRRASAAALDCHICFSDAPMDAVATSCGHVFCWPCMYAWFQNEGNPNIRCPVCSTPVAIDKNLLAIYGGATSAGSDSSTGNAVVPSDETVLPPRPRNPRKFLPRLPCTDGVDLSELASYAGALRHVQQEIARQKDENDCLTEQLGIEQRYLEAEVDVLLELKVWVVDEENALIDEEASLELQLAQALAKLPNGKMELPLEDEEELEDDKMDFEGVHDEECEDDLDDEEECEDDMEDDEEEFEDDMEDDEHECEDDEEAFEDVHAGGGRERGRISSFFT